MKLLKVLKTGEGHCAWILECSPLSSALKKNKNLTPHLGCSHCGMVVLGDDELVWRIRININRGRKQAENRTGLSLMTTGLSLMTTLTPIASFPWELLPLPSTEDYEPSDQPNEQQDSKDNWHNHTSRKHTGVCKIKGRISDITSLEQEKLFINTYWNSFIQIRIRIRYWMSTRKWS